jgi:hypothetical protein
MSRPQASTHVVACVEAGHAAPIQASLNGGYIVYEFLGGEYDGVKMRLYPPFSERIILRGKVYVRSGPKNGRSKRLTYRLEE